MKLKVISDGTFDGTSVVNEKGEKVEGVDYICWEMDFTSKTKNLSIQTSICSPAILEGESDRPIEEK